MNYSQIHQPIVVENHQVTNIVVPQTIQLHQVTRQILYPTQISPIKTYNQGAFARQFSPYQNAVRNVSNSQHSRNNLNFLSNSRTQQKPTTKLIQLSPQSLARTAQKIRVPINQYTSPSTNQKDIQKGEIMTKLNNIFGKLEVMDKSLNDLTETVHKVSLSPFTTRQQNKNYASQEDQPQFKRDQDQQIPKRYNQDHSTLKLDVSSKLGTYSTPDRQKKQSSDRFDRLRDSQINENLNKTQLNKGVQFGDLYYFGDINDQGLREGYGTLYDKNGQIIYCGDWMNDNYHNRGKLYFYDQANQRCIDLTSFQNQNLVNSNKISYTGQFSLGEIKGLGQMLFSKGKGVEKFIYYGRFSNGQFHGHGTVIDYLQNLDNENSQGLEGQWKHGQVQRVKEYSPKKVLYQ